MGWEWAERVLNSIQCALIRYSTRLPFVKKLEIVIISLGSLGSTSGFTLGTSLASVGDNFPPVSR